MEVQRKGKRGRPKRRWLDRVRVISKRRDCRGRKCSTKLHGGLYRRTSIPHKSGNTTRMKKKTRTNVSRSLYRGITS